VLRDEVLELGDQLGGAAAGQLRIDQVLVGHEPQLAQALCFRTCPVLGRELRVRVAPQSASAARSAEAAATASSRANRDRASATRRSKQGTSNASSGTSSM
jgi:hypothetical protein